MYLDSLYRIHLEWMFENQPELVRELMSKNKLKEHLDNKEQRALRLVAQLVEKHQVDELQAQDRATAAIRAPADGRAILEDDPPKPIPYQEREAIYRRLEALGVAEERAEMRDFKKDHHGLI
jgi:hypothetical protein